MTLKNRVKNVEKKLGISEGLISFATLEDGVYKVWVNGEMVEMNETEFEKWQASKSEKDVLFIVKRREYKNGDFVTKENENA